MPSWPIETQCRSAFGDLRRGRFDLFRRFFLDGDHDDVVSHRSSGVEHEKRKASVAGNQTELLCHLWLLFCAICVFCGPFLGAVVGLLPAAAQDHPA